MKIVRLLSLMPLLLLSSCVPSSYDVGYTLHDGKPAVYMPVCEGWEVKRFSLGVSISKPGYKDVIWELESVGGNTNFFVLGEVPSGYRVTTEIGSTDSFPLDARYDVGINQELPSKPGSSGPGAPAAEFDFTDAEEGVIKMRGKVVTLDQVNAAFASRCPG
ncbi:MAG: hypothetical protein LBI99_09130 [Propionibacteriaceae bacterium]|jgi:hypothetical protein|nr:hypothetical protein [Propionibacteriaceae bacterium]